MGNDALGHFSHRVILESGKEKMLDQQGWYWRRLFASLQDLATYIILLMATRFPNSVGGCLHLLLVRRWRIKKKSDTFCIHLLLHHSCIHSSVVKRLREHAKVLRCWLTMCWIRTRSCFTLVERLSDHLLCRHYRSTLRLLGLSPRLSWSWVRLNQKLNII